MTHDTIYEKWKFLEDKKYGSGGQQAPLARDGQYMDSNIPHCKS
jgi:hypothetical protein